MSLIKIKNVSSLEGGLAGEVKSAVEAGFVLLKELVSGSV